MFVRAAEESGAIVELGAWAIEEACRQGARWRARGAGFVVSVNVSNRQLEQGDIRETVERALGMSGLDPTALMLEVRESALVAGEDVAVALQGLRTMGVGLAIDDFGAGLSALRI